MKKKLILILTIVCLLCAATFTFGACAEKVQPIYQGMTIENSAKAMALAKARQPRRSNNGNGIGWGWGNEGKRPNGGEFIPEDDEDIDGEIEDVVTIEVHGDDTIKYYVRPNETFILQVHISNPDDYEIQSFTLNGKKYSNYMFKDGSTMEMLLLEVQAPKTPGYLELTIDAIKYLDGTEIKDVRMDGSKTIKAGVAYEQEPSATLKSQKIDTTKATFSFDVSDPQGVIGKNPITVYLSDGENKVAEQALKLGENTVTFENLTMAKTYQYGIATTYDLIDGYGEKAHWLLTDSFSTLKAFAITNGVATQNSVTYSLTKIGIVGNLIDVKLYDYDSGETVQTLSGTVAYDRFNNLLSDHAYVIEVNFEYVSGGETIVDSTQMAFATLAKTAPTVEITDATSTQTAISFKVATTDMDGILNVDKIELFLGEELVKTAENVDIREFTGLLSNNTYIIKATYSYNLNDGNGVHTQTATVEKATLAKTAPTVEITETTSTQTAISFKVATTDVDGILNVDKIELFLGEELVKTAENIDVREFTGLLSNNTYTIKATYSYNLNDGNGVHTQTATVEKATLAKTAPTVEITETTSTQTAISFKLVTTDVDGILTVTAVELLDGETLVQTLDKAKTEFNVGELSSGKTYTVKVTFTYNLNDGKGEHTQTVTQNYPTLIDTVAVTEVSLVNNNQVRLGEEINLRLYFDNPSSVQLTNIYINGEKVQVAGGDRKTYAIVRFKTVKSGLIDFYVDRVDYLLGGVEINQEVDSQAHATYPVFTDLDIHIENVSACPYKYTGNGIYFAFYNPQQYEVFKINDGTEFIQISDGEYYTKSRELTSIEYGYEKYGTTTQALNWQPEVFYEMKGYSVIRTVEDFLNMSDGYYVLMNDLDMRDVSISKSIVECFEQGNVVINGNGHTIRGLHNVIDTSNQKAFDFFYCDWWSAIFDVNFTELYVSIVNNQTVAQYISLFGDIHLYNCTVSGDINASGNISLPGYYDENGDYKSGLHGLVGMYDSSNTFNINAIINNMSETINQEGIKKETINAVEVTDEGAIYYHCSETGTILLGCFDTEVEELNLREDIVLICDDAFSGRTKPISVTIPDGVKSIWGEFSGLSCLTSITIGNGVTSIFERAFYNCSNLTSVIIGNSVANIGSYAFSGCRSLTSIIIPYGVTSIGERAFSNCSNLAYITIPDGVTSIGEYAFSTCSKLTSITIPDGVTSIGTSTFTGCSRLTSITIPDSVTSIGDSAFNSCRSLTSITIPYGVTSIGKSMFNYCSRLTDITIPDSVTSIGDNAFRCSGLTSIIIPDKVTSIGSNVFTYCNFTSITIPDSVTSLGEWAFSNCYSLTSVVIGRSVTSIGSSAFHNCNSLKTVYYNGTAENWAKINIVSNDSLTNATRYYYSENAPALNSDGTAYDGNYWHYNDNDEIVVWVYNKESN